MGTTAMQETDGAGALAGGAIGAWENDPGAPDAPYRPIARPRPALGAAPLALAIAQPAPGGRDAPGTATFRYWAAAEALRRASDHWASIIGPGARWHPAVGETLAVELDGGVDLNAYYDRAGLHFFHDTVAGHACFSGESSDVVCHEHGHAVLDGVRGELFDAPFIEAAAFHEAFGDVSAMLAALRLASVREALLDATGGRIHRSSAVSRLAEQLGWAIRQTAPDAVERDALRNAANSWFYRDPATLPPAAPASQLSSEPHSFSRVFSGAFLHALSGMLLARTSGGVEPRAGVAGRASGAGASGGRLDADAIAEVAGDAARLLHDAVLAAPVVPAYMSQIAAHVLAADTQLFGGRHRDALTGAFVKHGILSVPSATGLTAGGGEQLRAAAAAFGEPRADAAASGSASAGGAFGEPRADAAAAGDGRPDEPAAGGPAPAAGAAGATQLRRVALPGAAFGLAADVIVEAPVQAPRFAVAGATPDLGSVAHPPLARAAASFVEDLLRRGRIDLSAAGDRRAALDGPVATKSHELRPAEDGFELRRRLFDCGFGAA
jgi:hypothetical protein